MYHEIVTVKLNETSLPLIFYRAELLLPLGEGTVRPNIAVYGLNF